MTRTVLGALALAAAVLAAGGCGGSKGLSRAELIAKADPICQRANHALDSSKISSKNLASVAPGLATVEQQVSAELAKLTPPSSMVADWHVIVDGFRRTAVGLNEVGRVAKAGLSAKPTTALLEGEKEVSKGQQARATTAGRDGFLECARF